MTPSVSLEVTVMAFMHTFIIHPVILLDIYPSIPLLRRGGLMISTDSSLNVPYEIQRERILKDTTETASDAKARSHSESLNRLIVIIHDMNTV
jgi:hypothetical protein